jgi:inosine/xanthosine triphosphate pyrophosphatase family protein
MAALSAEEKNQLSHRARAVRNLLASLKVSRGA